MDRLQPPLLTSRAIIRSRGYLPHWEEQHSNATYFVTFRLANSLPRELLKQWKTQRRRLSSAVRAGAATAADSHALRILLKKVERELDKGRGFAYMLDSRVAELVFTSLMHFHNKRYVVHAACVMPNHVHIVLSPVPGHDLSSILHSWKSQSAHAANRLLCRRGRFWQREYFDHLIKDGAAFAKIVRYVVENPQRAGLRDWQWVCPLRDELKTSS